MTKIMEGRPGMPVAATALYQPTSRRKVLRRSDPPRAPVDGSASGLSSAPRSRSHAAGGRGRRPGRSHEVSLGRPNRTGADQLANRPHSDCSQRGRRQAAVTTVQGPAAMAAGPQRRRSLP